MKEIKKFELFKYIIFEKVLLKGFHELATSNYQLLRW